MTTTAVQVGSPRRQLTSTDQTVWHGEGWQVSIDVDEPTGDGAVRVEQSSGQSCL
jgi:hypothetical protein